MSQAVEFFEIDVPYCSLTYGVAPCAAALGVTGAARCFNTFATCQDTAHFAETTQTLRFAKPAEYLLDADAECLPWIVSIEFTPSTVSLGENLGARAVLKVTLSDHKHSDVGPGLDKYADTRGYDPYQRGSFWPRFRARFPSLQGAECRWKIGFADWAFDQYETRHFFIESYDGPDKTGAFTITAKDALKFLDGDRAQAPVLSSGTLTGALTAVATSLTLSPAGIGNAEYPASGHVRLSGREDVSFTRSSDTMTIVRGALGTTAQTHAAGDRVQLILHYNSNTPAAIAEHLLASFTDLPLWYIPIDEWTTEVNTYLNVVYTFVIGEPTPVKTILDRLIEQAGLAMWDDPLAQKLRMKVIRAVPITAQAISDDKVIAGSFDLSDQPDKRASRCWVYYAQNDPTKRHDDLDNYRSVIKVEDTASESIYGQPAIRKVFASGLAPGGAALASRIANIIVGRYRTPPRRIKFSHFRGALVPELGEGCQIDWRTLQDASGARELVPAQVIRFKPGAAIQQIEAEEMRYSLPPGGEVNPNIHTVMVDFNTLNLHARAMHDSLYGAPTSGQTVNFIVQPGVLIGSIYGQRALDIGTFPAGVTVNVVVYGRVQGYGGLGGGSLTNGVGVQGGPAIYVRSPINLAVIGELWAGGGGGGAGMIVSSGIIPQGGGGGGGGNEPGNGGVAQNGAVNGQPGDSDLISGGPGGIGFNPSAPDYGRGGVGGNVGLPGLPGNSSTEGGVSLIPGGGYAAGAAGNSIDGLSFVTKGTWSGTAFTPGTLGGDVRGPQIN